MESGRNAVLFHAMGFPLVEIPRPSLGESFVTYVALERFLACNEKFESSFEMISQLSLQRESNPVQILSHVFEIRGIVR